MGFQSDDDVDDNTKGAFAVGSFVPSSHTFRVVTYDCSVHA